MCGVGVSGEDVDVYPTVCLIWKIEREVRIGMEEEESLYQRCRMGSAFSLFENMCV